MHTRLPSPWPAHASAHVPPYAPDERTKTMLARVAASGSLWEDAADFEVPDPFDG